MNKYKVTHGDLSREVEAANEAEAERRFLSANPLNPTQPQPLMPPKVELSELLLPTVKKNYRVTWGDDSREVVAISESDAWSQFIGGNTDSMAWKNPNLHPRIITELGDVELNESQKREQEILKEKMAAANASLPKSDGKTTIIPGGQSHDISSHGAPSQGSTDDHKTTEVSPVADESAADATDKISRMHSVDKLREIAAADSRTSVQKAAQKRLEEIGG